MGAFGISPRDPRLRDALTESILNRPDLGRAMLERRKREVAGRMLEEPDSIFGIPIPSPHLNTPQNVESFRSQQEPSITGSFAPDPRPEYEKKKEEALGAYSEPRLGTTHDQYGALKDFGEALNDPTNFIPGEAVVPPAIKAARQLAQEKPIAIKLADRVVKRPARDAEAAGRHFSTTGPMGTVAANINAKGDTLFRATSHEGAFRVGKEGIEAPVSTTRTPGIESMSGRPIWLALDKNKMPKTRSIAEPGFQRPGEKEVYPREPNPAELYRFLTPEEKGVNWQQHLDAARERYNRHQNPAMNPLYEAEERTVGDEPVRSDAVKKIMIDMQAFGREHDLPEYIDKLNQHYPGVPVEIHADRASIARSQAMQDMPKEKTVSGSRTGNLTQRQVYFGLRRDNPGTFNMPPEVRRLSIQDPETGEWSREGTKSAGKGPLIENYLGSPGSSEEATNWDFKKLGRFEAPEPNKEVKRPEFAHGGPTIRREEGREPIKYGDFGIEGESDPKIKKIKEGLMKYFQSLKEGGI